MKPEKIADYTIIDTIAEGGSGIVYRVFRESQPGKLFAVKVLREEFMNDRFEINRFRNERDLARSINHRNIVQTFAYGKDGSRLYIVMEYLEGTTLTKFIRKVEVAAVSDILQIGIQIAEAMSEMHAANIVHRDLKPDNIVLTCKEDEGGIVKILDFGLARFIPFDSYRDSGHLFGTVSYMPPEYIADNDISSAGDIYSAGVIGYELISGQNPFMAESTVEMIKGIFNFTPKDLSKIRDDIPSWLSELIIWMLDKDPAKRPDADQVLNVLRDIQLSENKAGYLWENFC